MLYGSASFFGLCGWRLKIRTSAISREPSPPTSREPSPTDYTRIGIGDVGFIRRGQFHLLFSAASPVGDVPSASEPLNIGRTTFRGPRDPGCLRTDTVRRLGASLGATVPTPLYVPSLRPPSAYLKNAPPSPLQPGAHFSFELTGNHGAALMTRYPTYMEDALLESVFEKYIKRHYESWVKFARSEGYGDDIQPVLVSGFDATKDFAMLAYTNEGTFLEAGSDVAVPMLASAYASVWVTRHTRCSPHFKSGPQSWDLLPMVQAIDFPSSQLANARTIPTGFDQCVFIRYYTMRSKWLFPKVIRAGAGPHDLGSGGNRGCAFLELTG